MIDLHCHLLPGIDDGPDTLDQALQLADAAYKNGITHSILTPHIHPGRYNNNIRNIEVAFINFKKALSEHDIPLEIGFAGEVRLSDEVLPLVQSNDIPFYGEVNGYKVILLELPHSHIPMGSEQLIKWLLDRNIRPMIAHPERNKDIMRDTNKIKPFLQMGCLIQVTAASVVGLFGNTAQTCSHQLLKMGCVTVLASDAHNLKHRPPRLDHGRNAVAKILGENEAQRMVLDRPREIVSAQFPETLQKPKTSTLANNLF